MPEQTLQPEANALPRAGRFRLVRLLRSDLFAAVTLAWLAALTGMAYLLSPGGDKLPTLPPYFCSSAVTLACGRGFIFPEPGSIPALNEFLDYKTPVFTPDQLPAEFPTWEHAVFRETHQYFLYLLGAVWWLFGISWQTMKLLLAFFFVVSVLLVYGIFRLGMGRLLSAAGALIFMLSPLVLTALPMPRDLSKVPWLLAALLVMGVLVKGSWRRWPYLGMSALLGLIIGVGLGFRQDLLICIPPALVVVLFLARGAARLPVFLRLAAGAALIACFYVPASPILRATDRVGTLAYHNVMNGMATFSDECMGVGPASYEVMYCINDNYSHAVRTSYVRRVLDFKGAIHNEGYAAAWAGRQFVLEVLRTFPADQVVRVLSAVRYFLGDAVVHLQTHATSDEPLVAHAACLLGPIAAHMKQFGVIYAVAAFVLMGFLDVRAAIGAVFLLLFFTGYPVIQFQPRHVFHLVFAPYWVSGFVLHVLWRGVAALRGAETRALVRQTLLHPGAWWCPRVRNAIVFMIITVVSIAGSLGLATAWQRVTVGNVLEQHAAADLEELAVEQASLPDGPQVWRLFRPVDLPKPEIDSPDMWVWLPHEEYLAIDLQGDLRDLPIRIVYTSSTGAVDFGRTVYPRFAAASGADTVRYFFPIYEFLVDNPYLGTSAFQGIALPEDRADVFRKLYRVANLKDFRLLLNLALPEDRAQFQPRQTLW